MDQGLIQITPFIANYGSTLVEDVPVNISIPACSTWYIINENFMVDWIYSNGQCMQLDSFVVRWTGEFMSSGAQCTFVITELWSLKTFTFTVVFE
jgi:hypothetical protein